MTSTPETSFSSGGADFIRVSSRPHTTETACYEKHKKPVADTLPSPRHFDYSSTDPADASDVDFWSAGSFDSDSEDEPAQDDALQQAYRPTFHLRNQQTYQKLHAILSKTSGLLAHFQEKIRKDWNALTGVLTLRLMITAVHELCQEGIVAALKEELDRLATLYPSLRTFRDRKGKFRVPWYEASPDGQFICDGRICFILEVAYSQTKAKVFQKVQDYFKHARHPEFTLLVIKIKPPRSNERPQEYRHKGSVSLYTPKPTANKGRVIQCTINKQPFRDKLGQAMPGELLLPFKALIPHSEHDLIPEDARDATIQLSFESLTELLRKSEEKQWEWRREGEEDEDEEGPCEPITVIDTDGSIIWEATGEELEEERAAKRQRISPPQLRRSTRIRSMRNKAGV
ncbi:hypothetical protein F4803DRAFT_561614 [Xylaria telfairii]|nr:hypothetical protein F4803DRAFT_561614 [Xylaria telfairii]